MNAQPMTSEGIREMQAEIWESLATRRPATTLAEQAKQAKLMERARQTRLNQTVTSPHLSEHSDMTRRAHAMTDLRQSLEELKKGD